jgi:hypothetical protein
MTINGITPACGARHSSLLLLPALSIHPDGVVTQIDGADPAHSAARRARSQTCPAGSRLKISSSAPWMLMWGAARMSSSSLGSAGQDSSVSGRARRATITAARGVDGRACAVMGALTRALSPSAPPSDRLACAVVCSACSRVVVSHARAAMSSGVPSVRFCSLFRI